MTAFIPAYEPMPDAVDTGTSDLVAVLEFPFPPPLTANQRLHWRRKAELTKTLRTQTKLLARRIPDLGQCKVALTWFVTTRHRRDADNIVPTLKAMCDGLVDAGVVADDIPELMTKLMPTITYTPDGVSRMELRIETL